MLESVSSAAPRNENFFPTVVFEAYEGHLIRMPNYDQGAGRVILARSFWVST